MSRPCVFVCNGWCARYLLEVCTLPIENRLQWHTFENILSTERLCGNVPMPKIYYMPLEIYDRKLSGKLYTSTIFLLWFKSIAWYSWVKTIIPSSLLLCLLHLNLRVYNQSLNFYFTLHYLRTSHNLNQALVFFFLFYPSRSSCFIEYPLLCCVFLCYLKINLILSPLMLFIATPFVPLSLPWWILWMWL